MNLTMTPEEINLARRIIQLRGTSMKAQRNLWECRFYKDIPIRKSLEEKGLIEPSTEKGGWYWKLSLRGIQQLKLQIGEFSWG